MTSSVPLSRSALASFLRDQRGVTAIEFGMVGLPFLMLLLAIMVVGFLLFSEANLDYATEKAARQIMVGTTQTSALTADQFRTQVVCPLLPAVFTCSNVIVSLQTVPTGQVPSSYVNFVNASMTALVIPPLSNSQTSFCPGGSGQYKLLEIFYPMPVMLSIFANGPQVVNYNGQSALLLISTAAFRNEPYSNGNYTPPTGC